MLQAIFLLVIGTAVVGLLATSALQSSRSSQRNADRAIALPIADSAITRYLFALQSDIVTEGTDYVLTADAMQKVANTTLGDQVIPDAQLPGDPSLRSVEPSVANFGGAYTMREPLNSSDSSPGALYTYWQMYHVIRPTDYDAKTALATDDHSLIVYFRAWTGNSKNTAVTKPRLIRAQFRPGFFSDYQLVTDAPIQYGPGASINGPVHTNGYAIGSSDAGAGVSVSVSQGGSLRCNGATAKITAAYGRIDNSVPSNCLGDTGRNPTNKVVDFLQTEESFRAMLRDGDPSNPAPRTMIYRYNGSASTVVLKPDGSVTVNGRTLGLLGGRRPLALLFQGDVRVQGITTGRLTIAADNFTAPGYPTPPPGAADIYLLGNTGMPTTGTGNNVAPTNRGKDALGLIAEGNVYVPTSSSTGSCATMISAAIIAESGRVSLPTNETTQVEQSGLSACNSPLTMYGSMASHMAPILYWKWGAGGASTGYQSRTYSYNAFLREGPPPYFPRSSVWRVAAWKDANYDCLQNSASLTDRNCR